MNQEIRNYVMQKMSPFLDNGQTMNYGAQLIKKEKKSFRLFMMRLLHSGM